MPTFNLSNIRSRAKLNAFSGKTVETAIEEFAASSNAGVFDIYLSIPQIEPELILGTALTLQDFGYSICIDTQQVNRAEKFSISREEEKRRRTIMDRCKSMVHLTSTAKSQCAWLPWECGYFQGRQSRVTIFPITPTNAEIFRGDDFLGLFPFLVKYQTQHQQSLLAVKFGVKIYCTFDNWLKGGEGLLEG